MSTRKRDPESRAVSEDTRRAALQAMGAKKTRPPEKARSTKKQSELYKSYARDPERQAVARADQKELLRGGVIGRAKRAKPTKADPYLAMKPEVVEAMQWYEERTYNTEGRMIARATGVHVEPPAGSETTVNPDLASAKKVSKKTLAERSGSLAAHGSSADIRTLRKQAYAARGRELDRRAWRAEWELELKRGLADLKAGRVSEWTAFAQELAREFNRDERIAELEAEVARLRAAKAPPAKKKH
jgi:hypothetical protein